ncbi:MAG: hypothetical protein MI810_00845 [Flavobacteriales bacterium]|nr:hypothetical protein [Flavobacteriales bacterium]
MELTLLPDALIIDGTQLNLPLTLSNLTTHFKQYDSKSEKDERTTYIWDKLGISALVENETELMVDFRINMKPNDLNYIPAKNCFEGTLTIDGKDYLNYFKITEKDYLFKDLDFGSFTGAACISKEVTEIVAVMIQPKPSKEESDNCDKYQIQPIDNAVTEFADFNFKLAVIDHLMYDLELLQPQFDVHEFIDCYKERKINLDDHYYEVVPEVREYFEKLPIPTEYLEKVEEIFQDGGNEIYMQIVGFWDGEDDLFNITNTADLSLLPNLKKITLFYDDEEKMADEFVQKGIEAEYL